MSVSKWAWTDECEGRVCVGDCDLCSYPDETEGEKILCRMIELFLEENPEKKITVHREMIGGEFRYKAEVVAKNIKVK